MPPLGQPETKSINREHPRALKRFDEPVSVPFEHEILPHPNDDGTHAVPFARHASVRGIGTLKKVPIEKLD
jgi:hypothetical protein